MKRTLPKKFYQMMKNHMRRISMRSPVYREVKLRGRIRKVVGMSKNGNPKFKFFHICELCGAEVEYYETDHIKEVASSVRHVDKVSVEIDLGEFMEAMLPEAKDLQKLCVDCHSQKTSQFNATRGNLGRHL